MKFNNISLKDYSIEIKKFEIINNLKKSKPIKNNFNLTFILNKRNIIIIITITFFLLSCGIKLIFNIDLFFFFRRKTRKLHCYNKIIIEKKNINFNRTNIFFQSKIDEKYLINLNNHLKNEKTYDINTFSMNKKVRKSINFDEREENEALNITKFTVLSRNLYLLTSIPKQTYVRPFISICFPVYNIENFLPGLVRSFQNQNFKNFELVFVDDSSIDKSEKIIKFFQTYDKRIKYIKLLNNRGTGYARSLAIEYSTGKYIAHFDPDDLEADFDVLKTIYKKAINTGVEYIKSDQIKFKNNQNTLTKEHYFSPQNEIIFNDEFRHAIFKRDKTKVFGGVHNDVLKGEICKKALNKIKGIYKESKVKIVYMEDLILCRAFANEAKSLYFLQKFTYFYDKNYNKGKIRMSNIEQNMLQSYITELYFQKVQLTVVKSRNELSDILKSFDKEYKNYNFKKINIYFKEDFIEYCIGLIHKINLFNSFDSKIFFEKEKKLVFEKMNLVLNKNDLIKYSNGRD